MKNIKVNIINHNGVKSSTTINYVICEQYYNKRMLDTKDDYLTITDREKGIALVAQSFTNDLMEKQINSDCLGVGQYAIESCMLYKIIELHRTNN